MKLKVWARISGTNTKFRTEVDVEDSVIRSYKKNGYDDLKIRDMISAVAYQEMIKDMIYEWCWEEDCEVSSS